LLAEKLAKLAGLVPTRSAVVAVPVQLAPEAAVSPKFMETVVEPPLANWAVYWGEPSGLSVASDHWLRSLPEPAWAEYADMPVMFPALLNVAVPSINKPAPEVEARELPSSEGFMATRNSQ